MIDGSGAAGTTLLGTDADDVLALSALTLVGVSLIDAGAGNDAVTGSAAAGRIDVLADTNGDAVADLMIRIAGGRPPALADFAF